MDHIVMFSGGVGSYCAAKRVIQKVWPEKVVLLFADTLIEDEDLYRFLDDASRALGVEITRITYGKSPWQVFRDNRFLGNSRIDLCSRLLKRELMDKWIVKNYPDPTTVKCYVGIDWNEEHRFTRMAPRKLPYVYEAPMVAPPFLLKEQMLKILHDDGVEIPRLYKMGFAHNNCGGFCVKAGIGHFQNLLRKMPDRYKAHEKEEAEFGEFIGKPVTILRRQRDGVKSNLSLRQLRKEVEAGCVDPSEALDFGGCGCALDDAPENSLDISLEERLTEPPVVQPAVKGDANMATYNVSPDVNSIIKEYADSIGVKPEEALNKLILTADSRRKALKKYAKTQKVPKAPEATKGKKEKKAAPKGTSLAKKKAPAKAKKVKGDPKPINIPVVSGGDESAPLP